MITDTGPSVFDTGRPPTALLARQETRRSDREPPFNLLLAGAQAPSAGTGSRGPRADKSAVSDRDSSDHTARNSIAGHNETARRGDNDDQAAQDEAPSTDDADARAVPSISPPASIPSRANDDAVPATSAGDADPGTPAIHTLMTDEPAGPGGGSVTSSAELGAAEGGKAQACSQGSGFPSPEQSQPLADGAAVGFAASLEAQSEGINAAITAAAPTGPGDAGDMATTPSPPHPIGASAAAGVIGSMPGKGGSPAVQIDKAAPATPAPKEGQLAAVPAAAAADEGTRSDDDQMSHQGDDRGESPRLAGAPGTPAAETASSAGPTSEQPATPVRALSEQIALHMARGAKNGLSHLHIALEPDNLGRLDIRLDFHRDGRLAAVIVADSPDTLNLLRREAHSLEESLNAAGFKANADSLSFDLSSNSGRSPGQPGAPLQRSPFAFAEGSEHDDVAIATPAWRRLSAGRLDIRA